MKNLGSQKTAIPIPQSGVDEDLLSAANLGGEERVGSVFGELMILTKARLSSLVVVTAVVGFLLASGKTGGISWWGLLHTVIGVALVAGAASVFNQIIEIRPDGLMKRTADRPLPTGRFKTVSAYWFGAGLCVLGCTQLFWMLGLLPAGFALLTVAVYVLIYTPMKRSSSWCTIVGGVAGAIPPVIGWTAGGGGLDAGAASLFAILFFWQLPHFLAINWLYREDYENAGFKMWSNYDVSGLRTARLALGFTVLLVLATVSPLWAGLGNVIYLLLALVLTGGVLALAVRFLLCRSPERARQLFYSTLIYLPLLLGALVFTSR